MEAYVSRSAQTFGIDRTAALSRIAQYGRTSGIVGEHVARQLIMDEGLPCTGSQIFVTSGCQEAIDFCVSSLCGKDGLLIVRSPCYARGKTLRVLYLTPEFDNPTGEVMSIATRQAVISLCAERGVVILEDSPCRMFRYEGARSPSRFSLGEHGCVVSLGPYSKTLCPSLRVGFAVLPEKLFGSQQPARDLMELLGQRKSYSTVNTSQIAQAVVAGFCWRKDIRLSGMPRRPAASIWKTVTR